MKTVFCCTVLSLLIFAACNTPKAPKQITFKGITLLLPAGFNLGSKDGAASYGPYSASQELYEKIDGGNTATLKIFSFDVQHMATEDPEFVTESVLG